MSTKLRLTYLPLDDLDVGMSLQELDLVFRSAMQSGVVAAEEGEMIASVRNLDSKKIKAGDAAMSSESNLGVAACRGMRQKSCGWPSFILSGQEIMTPLVDMICIESEEPIAKLHHLIKATQFLGSIRVVWEPYGVLWESGIHFFPHCFPLETLEFCQFGQQSPMHQGSAEFRSTKCDLTTS